MNVDAYFDKPIDAQALLAKVGELCSPPGADARRLRTMNEDRVPYLQLVTTIREKCRRCYTCVRECPAKAIQIEDGQASVIQTRCIGCGNCVTVCSQNAKQVLSGIEDDRGAARRRRAGRGHRGAELPGRVHGVQHARARRRPARARLLRRPRGQLRRRPRRRGVRAPAGRARRAPHRHHLPGGRQLRAQVPPRHPRPPRAHRLAHAGDRPRAAQEVRPGAQDRVRRALHRQEGRGALRAVRGRGPRGPHLRGAPRPPRRARRQPARARGVPRGLRPAARQPRRPLPHHARHAPGGRTSTRTCSAATS